jgi:hypothetical protein
MGGLYGVGAWGNASRVRRQSARSRCGSAARPRTSDVAAHLVDGVLPPAPYRQWTWSVPWRWRLALARDRQLLSRASTAFVRASSAGSGSARALGILNARGARAVVTARSFGRGHAVAPRLRSTVRRAV